MVEMFMYIVKWFSFFGACIWYELFFFFSSRRRHTRFDCDWSSDVCSSDLGRQKTRTVGDLPFRQTQEDLQGAAGALLRLGPVELASQILGRHTTFPTTGGPAENSYGAHAQIAVALGVLGDQLFIVPGYRYAIYDP